MYSGFTHRQALTVKRALFFVNPKARVTLIGVFDGYENARQWTVCVELHDKQR